MNLQAFGSAEKLAKRASDKVRAMNTVTDMAEIADLYSEFLEASNKFFNKLDHALRDGPSAAWWGQIKAQRKSDELLQYVQHARHSDEHRADVIAAEKPPRIEWQMRRGDSMSQLLIEPSGKVSFGPGEKFSTRLLDRSIAPQTVTNRGKQYPRPYSHLGKPIHASTVNDIAEMALVYMNNVVGEARSKFLS